MDEEIEHPQNKKIKVELPPFTEPFKPCLTVVRAATWNCQQLRFIDERMLDSTAHYLTSSFDLILLQEIPPGKFGKYRLSQLVRAMNGGTSLVAPKFLYLLGEETTVNDTSSQLNAIIYPASWKVLHSASITSFLHPPIIAWFKPENGETVVAGSFHVSGLLLFRLEEANLGLSQPAARQHPQPTEPRCAPDWICSSQRSLSRHRSGTFLSPPIWMTKRCTLAGSLVVT